MGTEPDAARTNPKRSVENILAKRDLGVTYHTFSSLGREVELSQQFWTMSAVFCTAMQSLPPRNGRYPSIVAIAFSESNAVQAGIKIKTFSFLTVSIAPSRSK